MKAMSTLVFEKIEKIEAVSARSTLVTRGLLALASFLTAFLACVFHNLAFCESRIMLATDGKHFLTTVALLVEYLRQHVAAADGARFLSESLLPGHIMFDGPIMSLIYAPLFLLLQKVPTPRDWFTLSLGQSVFHGLSTTLLTLITYRLTGSRLFAAMAAILFGLYPPAVLQSGHFMSEMPITTILLLLFFLATAKRINFLNCSGIGICTALLVLSKPALIPCAALLSTIVIIKAGFDALNAKGKGSEDEASYTSYPNSCRNGNRISKGSELNTGAHVGSLNGKWSYEYPTEPRSSGRIATLLLLPFRAVFAARLGLSGFMVGLILVLAPWSIFSFETTGNIMPTAQRQPLFNVVTGWNTEADGWAHNPHTPFAEMFSDTDGSPLQVAVGIWKNRPADCFSLAISKLSRLSSVPWNDFKGRSLGLDENAQVLLHRLLIACAAFGAAIFAFCSHRYLSSQQRYMLTLALATVVAHSTYVMVECQPRYGFTAMPFVVLLAVYGIWQASQLSFNDSRRRLTICFSVGLALALTAFLLHAENFCKLFDQRNLKEHFHTLAKHEQVEKDIDLSGVKTPEHVKSVLLLVDGDYNIEKCQVEVNGTVLNGKLISTMHSDAAHYALYDQLREFGPAMRVSVEDFRQWRAIEIPTAQINWHGINRFKLTSTTKVATVYGDGAQHSRYSLSPDFCNYGILAAAPVAAGAESRWTDPVLTAALKQDSYMTTVRENGGDNAQSSSNTSNEISAVSLPSEAAKGDDPTDDDATASMPESRSATNAFTRRHLRDSLRLKLLVLLDDNGAAKVGDATAQKTVSPASQIVQVSRKSFDRLLWDSNSSDCLRMNKVVLYSARTVGADISLPEIGSGTHLRVIVRGELRALKNPGEVGLLCALKGAKGQVQILGKTPRAIAATSEWRKFKIEDLIPLQCVGGSAKAIELALYPCPWMEGQYGVSRRATDALFRNITIEVSADEMPQISGRRVMY